MKKMNSKKLIATLCISLGCISLVGVGLSAWIIQSNSVETSNDITVSVADAENQLVTIEGLSLTDDSIYLDAKEGDNVAPIKHSQDDNGLVEDLTLAFEFKINKATMNNFNGIHYRLIDNTGDNSLATFVNDNEALIVMPGAFTSEDETGETYYPLVLDNLINSDGGIVSGSETTYYNATQSSTTSPGDSSNHNIQVSLSETVEGEVTYINFEITLSLKWGSTFGGVNPSLYREGVSATLDAIESAEEVIDNIKTVQDGINNKAFAIEISHLPGHTAAI